MSSQFDAVCASFVMIAYLLECLIRTGFFVVMDIVGLDTVILLYCLLLIVKTISRGRDTSEGAEQVLSVRHDSTWGEDYGE